MSIRPLPHVEFPNAVVERLEMDGSLANRLKSLGVFEGQRIELTKRGNPLIIKAAGSRVAIAPPIAQRIFVRELDE